MWHSFLEKFFFSILTVTARRSTRARTKTPLTAQHSTATTQQQTQQQTQHTLVFNRIPTPTTQSIQIQLHPFQRRSNRPHRRYNRHRRRDHWSICRLVLKRNHSVSFCWSKWKYSEFFTHTHTLTTSSIHFNINRSNPYYTATYRTIFRSAVVIVKSAPTAIYLPSYICKLLMIKWIIFGFFNTHTLTYHVFNPLQYQTFKQSLYF